SRSRGTRDPTHGAWSAAHIVTKYHADETSIDNGPRWFNRFLSGRAVAPRPPEGNAGRVTRPA
ncbi:MAG: hypothetical protein IJ658_01500, partial [Kiritimatiellae bacterium]|nr:hypothetical protein [Kiritimatiellia bacterium]